MPCAESSATTRARLASATWSARLATSAARLHARWFARATSSPPTITAESLNTYLGVMRFRDTPANEKSEIGLVTGLAWTEVGGCILTTEVAIIDGKGKLTLTGKLGDVMQESAQAAMSYLRSRWQRLGIPRDFYRNVDIHVHVPGRSHPQGRSLGGNHHRDGHRQRAEQDSGSPRYLHDRRNYPARKGSADRRPEGEAAGGASRRNPRSRSAGGEREGLGRCAGEPSKAEMKLHFVDSMDEVLQIALEHPLPEIPVASPMPAINPQTRGNRSPTIGLRISFAHQRKARYPASLLVCGSSLPYSIISNENASATQRRVRCVPQPTKRDLPASEDRARGR